MISPEATYPIIRRSIAYRFGAFQLLAQIALQKSLPENVSPHQVRATLFTMIKSNWKRLILLMQTVVYN